MEGPASIYLCGGGAKGNIGAEAILLATLKLLRRRLPSATFTVTCWNPLRIRRILDQIGEDSVRIVREHPLAAPRELRRADLVVMGDDAALAETSLSFFPAYYGLRALSARAAGVPMIFIGIEAGEITRLSNRAAICRLIAPGTGHFITRNPRSVENLRKFLPQHPSIRAGCEPVLTLREENLAGFEPEFPEVEGATAGGLAAPSDPSGPLIGFAVRDLFRAPLRVNLLSMRIERRDARRGEVTAEMRRIISFTARLADGLAKRYDARLLFIPHHFLPDDERIILNDRDIAAMVMREMKRPGHAAILKSGLHPFAVASVYKRLDMVFSMRHHANSFAFLHSVPAFAYSVNEKTRNFYRDIGMEEMLLDPLSSEAEGVPARIDDAMGRREAIARKLRESLAVLRARMEAALDSALGDFF